MEARSVVPDIQLALDLGEFLRSETVAPEGTTIEERFTSFHERNPHIYRALVSIARTMKNKGSRRVSPRDLFGHLRVTRGYMPTVGDKFQLNNSFCRSYARLIVRQERDLASMFELRELKAA